MAALHLPGTLTPLFPGLTRHHDVDAPTVRAAIESLDEQWPGLEDRLCEPGPLLRQHIHVYVNRERAELETPVAEHARVDVIAAISGGA